jgi:hypothetical protein
MCNNLVLLPIKNSGLFFFIVIYGMEKVFGVFNLFSDPSSFSGKGKSILTGLILTLGFLATFLTVCTKYFDSKWFI